VSDTATKVLEARRRMPDGGTDEEVLQYMIVEALQDLDPDLPYQAKKSDPVTYDVDFAVVVTAPYHTKTLKVWLPLPQDDAAQEVEEKELTAFPMKIEPRIGTEKTFGNKFAYFEFSHPEGAQIIRHKFKINVWELHWNVDPGKVAKVERWPPGFDRHLRGDLSIVVDDRFLKLAQDVVPEKHGAARDLADVMDWVNNTMRYDHAAASLRASSEHALTNKAGHCSDYHGLCAAVGRALGYPTRVTYGIGWVSFDVSETQRLIDDIKKDTKLGATKKDELIRAAKHRLRRGFRDNTWYLQTRGTDYDLAPPASQRVPVVRTIYAEADGVALPDPDPAAKDKREFAWMTIHRYTPDRVVKNPFKH